MANTIINLFNESTETAVFDVPAFVNANTETAWQDRIQKAYYNGLYVDTCKALKAYEDIKPEELTAEEQEDKKQLEELQKQLEELQTPAEFIPHICYYILSMYLKNAYKMLPAEGDDDDDDISRNERTAWKSLYNACLNYYNNGYAEGRKSETAEQRIRKLYLEAINSLLPDIYTTGSFAKSEDGTQEFSNIQLLKVRRKVTNVALQACINKVFPDSKGKKSKEDRKTKKTTKAGFTSQFPKPEAFKKAVVNNFLNTVGVKAEEKKKA